MSVLQAIVLGAVQGLTELLPVSSPAHLALVPWVLGWKPEPAAVFSFDVLVQWGTLLAVIAYFWRDLWGLLRAAALSLWRRSLASRRRASLGSWSSPPSRLRGGGILLKGWISDSFSRPAAVAGFPLAMAAFLFMAEIRPRLQRGMERVNLSDAIWVGIAQVFSLFAGICRSGATMGAGLLRGLDRRAAAKSSFLLSVPVLVAADCGRLLRRASWRLAG